MRRPLLLVCSAVLALLVTVPAYAGQVTVDDRAGDTETSGLDITRLKVSNRERAVVATVRFAELVRGEAIVGVSPRDSGGVLIVSKYRPGKPARTRLLAGSFTDPSARADAVQCDGLSARWDADRSLVRMRLPARCLQEGDYDAIRAGVLVERDARDVDFAPEMKVGATRWIPRG